MAVAMPSTIITSRIVPLLMVPSAGVVAVPRAAGGPRYRQSSLQSAIFASDGSRPGALEVVSDGGGHVGCLRGGTGFVVDAVHAIRRDRRNPDALVQDAILHVELLLELVQHRLR